MGGKRDGNTTRTAIIITLCTLHREKSQSSLTAYRTQKETHLAVYPSISFFKLLLVHFEFLVCVDFYSSDSTNSALKNLLLLKYCTMQITTKTKTDLTECLSAKVVEYTTYLSVSMVVIESVVRNGTAAKFYQLSIGCNFCYPVIHTFDCVLFQDKKEPKRNIFV